MGSSKPKPDAFEYVETGAEPEYFCTHTRIEQAGNGNLRIYCYALRHERQLHLLYTVIVPAPNLAGMARKSLSIAAEAHNLAMWEADGEGH